MYIDEGLEDAINTRIEDACRRLEERFDKRLRQLSAQVDDLRRELPYKADDRHTHDEFRTY